MVDVISQLKNYGVSRGISSLIGLLSIPILIRLTDEASFAKIQLLLSLSTLFIAIHYSGIVSSTLRLEVMGKVRKQEIVFSTYAIFFFSSLLLYFNLLYIEGYSVYFIGYLVSFAFIDLKLSSIRASGGVSMYGYLLLSRQLLILLPVVAYVAYYKNLGPDEYFMILSISLSALGLLFHVIVKNDILVKIDTYKYALKKILTFGFFVTINGVVVSLFTVLMKFSFNEKYGIEELAIFSAGYDMGERIMGFVNSTFTIATSTVFFKLYDDNDYKGINKFSNECLNTYILLAMPLITIVIINSNILSEVFFGVSYRESGFYMVASLLSGFSIGLLHRYTILFSSEKKPYKIFIIFSIALALFYLVSFLSLKFAILNELFAFSPFIAFMMVFLISNLFLSNEFDINFDIKPHVFTIPALQLICYFVSYLMGYGEILTLVLTLLPLLLLIKKIT